MKVTAIRNFLHNSQHVASGTLLDLDSATAKSLITAGRVIVAPADIAEKTPAKGAKK